MSIHQFLQLNQQRKAALANRTGKLLAERRSKGYQIKLYLLEGFFIELWHNEENEVVEFVNCFTDRNCFLPYLESFKLSGSNK